MHLLHELLYTSLGAASLCYVIVRLCQSYWKNRGILHEKPKFLWGNVKGVGKKRHLCDSLQRVYDRYKGQAPFVGYFVLLKPMVLILDLDLIQKILTITTPTTPVRTTTTAPTSKAEHFAGGHVVSLPGSRLQLDHAEWQTMCQHAKSLFHSDDVQQQSHQRILHNVEQHCQRLDAQLRGSSLNAGEVNVYQFAQSLHMDMFAGLAFGQWTGSDLTKFRSITRQHLETNFSLLRAYICLHMPWVARYITGCSPRPFDVAYYVSIVEQELRDRRRMQLAGRSTSISPTPVDFLQLLEATMPQLNYGCDRVYFQRLATRACAYLFIGLESCNGTLAFCLYELALHPEVQQKAFEEITQVLQEQSSSGLQWEHVSQFVYLRQILYEALRKYSPYPILLRTTTQDYEIDDSIFLLQAGNELIIPIAAIHNDPLLYPEPERFVPERFESSALKARHPAAWLPFGGIGARSCFAHKLIECQLITVLAALLHRYEFTPSTNTPIPMQYDNTKIVLTPKFDELQLNVRLRKN